MSPKKFLGGQRPAAIDPLIDTDLVASLLRPRVMDTAAEKILISRLAGSTQESDLSVPPNGGGFGRIRHFHRKTAAGWPANPLPIDPACRSLSIPSTDLLRVQVFQNSACAWRCWYCFVPFSLLSGDPKKGAWFSAGDLIELYLEDGNRPVAIDLTGGSPDLTPEWPLWMMRSLRKRGLHKSVYLWSDDNLSTDYYWRFLTQEQRSEIADYRNYGRVACFKGYDADSFSFNTQAEPAAFDRQFDLMRRLLNEGLDCYAYATFTGPHTRGLEASMHTFVDRLQDVHPNLPLRTIPLRIEAYTPAVARLNAVRASSLDVQDQAVHAWNAEIALRFTAIERTRNIYEVTCGRERPEIVR